MYYFGCKCYTMTKTIDEKSYENAKKMIYTKYLFIGEKKNPTTQPKSEKETESNIDKSKESISCAIWTSW